MTGARTLFSFFFFNDTATTEIYTLSLHDALPISRRSASCPPSVPATRRPPAASALCPSPRRSRPVCRTPGGACREAARPSRRSEEHTSELQSQSNLVCRLLLEKKKKKKKSYCIQQ